MLVCLSQLACTSLRFVDVASENKNGRVDYLIVHYTSVDFAESLRLLTQRTERRVSSHYLIPDLDDPTYPRRRLAVYRLVDENERAWHAGLSFWRGVSGLNSRSIGIEVVNQSTCTSDEAIDHFKDPHTHCEFRDYDPEQIEIFIRLVKGILKRHPSIEPGKILAHSDVSPDRKLDPGPTFPWRALYDHGIGAWYDEETMKRYLNHFEVRGLDVSLIQRALGAYGYDIEATGELDQQSQYVIRAFQMHFRPGDWSGHPDAETAAIVFALLEKYRPKSLEALNVGELPIG